MKGIVKYQNKLYRKSNKPIKEGDLIRLNCKRGSQWFQHNGVYVVDKYNCIHTSIGEDGKSWYIKLGYNVFRDDYYRLELNNKKKKNLPKVLKEEQEY